MFIDYEMQDAEEVGEFLEQTSYRLSWGEAAETTLLALDGEKLIGAASLSKNDFHPHREYIGVYIHPDFRRKGIGTALCRRLLSRSQTKQLQAAISSKDETAVSFLKACGFVCARKCYTPDLKKEQLRVPSGSGLNHILPYDEATKKQKEETLELQLENYKECHQAINPLSDAVSFDEWKKIVLDGLNPRHSFVSVEGRQVQAAILCYGEEDEIEIGYVCGKDSAHPERYRSFYQRTIEELFKDCQTVSIEADDIDPFAFSVLNCFRYDKSDSWDTYIFDS